jgi:lipoprotein-anchoring transpeptidase ErfK/SrfK
MKYLNYVGYWMGIGLCFVLATTSSLSAADAEPRTKKEIHVDIERQILIAIENGNEVYTFDVVTGRDGKETTAGRYSIFRKEKKYTSKTYGSEMPYTMFFSSDGKAIHGTLMPSLRSYLHAYLTESVGSQGCVGLTDDDAKALFEWAPLGTPVVIISDVKK